MLGRSTFWESLTGVIRSGMRRSSRYSQAVKLDPIFAEAYLGWGFSLSSQEIRGRNSAITDAERLMPANPEVHHSLATALFENGA